MYFPRYCIVVQLCSSLVISAGWKQRSLPAAEVNFPLDPLLGPSSATPSRGQPDKVQQVSTCFRPAEAVAYQRGSERSLPQQTTFLIRTKEEEECVTFKDALRLPPSEFVR